RRRSTACTEPKHTSLYHFRFARLKEADAGDRVNPLLVGKGETSRPTKDGLVLAAVHHGLQDPSECGRASFESRYDKSPCAEEISLRRSIASAPESVLP